MQANNKSLQSVFLVVSANGAILDTLSGVLPPAYALARDFNANGRPEVVLTQFRVDLFPTTQDKKKAFVLEYDGPTSVDRPNDVATQLSLLQNYPNPFNPTTTIRYELPKAAAVSLTIFYILGQHVAKLIDERKEAGHHQVQWNANVPSGIYFYRLQARPTEGGQAGDASTGSAQGFVETRKMILLR